MNPIMKVYEELETRKYEFDEDLFPRYFVRLDAGVSNDSERYYRLFVRRAEGAPHKDAEDDLRFVLDLAQEHGLTPTIENNGIELSFSRFRG